LESILEDEEGHANDVESALARYVGIAAQVRQRR
jgi:hypothetical protein